MSRGNPRTNRAEHPTEDSPRDSRRGGEALSSNRTSGLGGWKTRLAVCFILAGSLTGWSITQMDLTGVKQSGPRGPNSIPTGSAAPPTGSDSSPGGSTRPNP